MIQQSLQAMMDGLSIQWQKERAQTGLTLGKLIAYLQELEAIDPETLIQGLGELSSYRGHYVDLAFEPSTESTTVTYLLAVCRATMGQVFTGYKGGEFMMGSTTPLWVAPYGCTGERLMGFNNGSPMTPITAPEDDA
jgi:hypothetical protein